MTATTTTAAAQEREAEEDIDNDFYRPWHSLLKAMSSIGGATSWRDSHRQVVRQTQRPLRIARTGR